MAITDGVVSLRHLVTMETLSNESVKQSNVVFSLRITS